MLDVKRVQDEARKELVEEATEVAKEKLKELYQRLEKSKLVTRNVQSEIDLYLKNISDLTTYEAAGVDTNA